jgi:hypothetical protein
LRLTPLSDPPTAKIIAGDGRMRVTVKLFGPLLERLPSEKRRMPLELEVPDGATVNDLSPRC